MSNRLTFDISVSLEDDDIDLFRLSRNDEVLFEYDRNATIVMNPYLEEIENDAHIAAHKMIPKILLKERWHISKIIFNKTKFGIEEHINRLQSTARGRCLIQNDDSGIWIYGITCKTPEGSRDRLHAKITESSIQFARRNLIDYLTSTILNSIDKAFEISISNFRLPESLNVEDWTLSSAEVDQAIALLSIAGANEGVDEWTTYSLGKLVQANILSNYRLEGEKNNTAKFIEFLKSEYRSNYTDSELRAGLEVIPYFLSSYLHVAQELMAEATLMHHIRGDRSSPSSKTYYHVSPHRLDTRGGTWFNAPEIVLGNRQLISRGDPTGAHPDSRSLDNIALSIARSSLVVDSEAGGSKINIIDHINKLVESCMPSMARFKFRAETYRIKCTTDDDTIKNAHVYDGHFLMSFYVEDSKTAGLRRSFDEVGSGLGYVLPILAALVEGKQIVSIEQPELHLHPQAQSELMIAIVRSGRQVILETHSERFIYELSALLRKQSQLPSDVSENVVTLNQMEIKANNISINYIDTTKQTTKPILQVTQICFSNNGRLIDDWPRGFNWMAVSPAFQQIGLFDQDEQVARELRALPWLAAQSENLCNWTIKASVAYSRQDWDATIIYVAKIMEELINIKIEWPLIQAFADFQDIDEFAVSDGHLARPVFEALKKGLPNKRLTLGVWKSVLVESQLPKPNTPKLVRTIGDWLKIVDWSNAWYENKEIFLKELDKLHKCRNRAAHIGWIQMEDARRLLALAIDLESKNDAGLAYKAFGINNLSVAFRESNRVTKVALQLSAFEIR